MAGGRADAEGRRMSGFVHISAPLASELERLAAGRPMVEAQVAEPPQVAETRMCGEGHVITAGSPGLVDFHQTSSPTERTSSPLACSAHSGAGRTAATGPA